MMMMTRKGDEGRVMAGRGGCCRDWWRWCAAGTSAQPLVAAPVAGGHSAAPTPDMETPEQWCSDRTRPQHAPATCHHAPPPAARVAQVPAPPSHVTRVAPPPPRPRVARVGRPAAQCGVLAAAADGHAPCPAHHEHDSFKYGTSRCHRCYSFSHLFRYGRY